MRDPVPLEPSEKVRREVRRFVAREVRRFAARRLEQVRARIAEQEAMLREWEQVAREADLT